MASFKDENGKQWILKIRLPQKEAVQDALGVDLFDISKDGIFHKLAANDLNAQAKAIAIAYVICQPECEKCGIDEEAFCNLMGGGDTMVQVAIALQEALLDFFPPDLRRALSPMVAKLQAANQQVVNRAIEKVGSKEMDAFLQSQVDRTMLELDKLLTSHN